jgi:hypothetical protein
MYLIRFRTYNTTPNKNLWGQGASERKSAAKYLYWSISMKSRHLGFGVFIDIWSMGKGEGASFLAFHVHKERPRLTALPFSLSDHKENGRGVYNSGLLMCISFSKGWLTESIKGRDETRGVCPLSWSVFAPLCQFHMPIWCPLGCPN